MKVRESTPPQETRRPSIQRGGHAPAAPGESVSHGTVSQSVSHPVPTAIKSDIGACPIGGVSNIGHRSPIWGVSTCDMCSMLSRVWAVRARGRAAAAQPPCPDTRASGGPSASRDSSTLVSTGYCSRRLDAIPSATHFYTKSQTAKQTASCCGLTKHDWMLDTVQSLRPKVNSGRFLTKLGSFLDNNSFC